jgi:hypothetical protein
MVASRLISVLARRTRGWENLRLLRIVISGFLLAAANCAVASEKIPIFPKNISYEVAQLSLHSLGWEPVTQDKKHCDSTGCYDRCARGSADRCETYPEAEACHEFGLASCEMIWRRGSSLIEVRTFSAEVPPYVDRVQCRAGC